MKIYEKIKEFGEMDVWIFSITLNPDGDMLNFNKGYGRNIPFQKVSAKVDATRTYSMNDVSFHKYSKNGMNVLKQKIPYSKNGTNRLNVFDNEEEAYEAYQKHITKLQSQIQEYKNKLDKFSENLII